MIRPQHFRKGAWFRAVVAELQQAGFTPGGRCAPRAVQSYVRKGVFVEISAGNHLRVIKQNGAAFVHCVPNFKDARLTIAAAALTADFPD